MKIAIIQVIINREKSGGNIEIECLMYLLSVLQAYILSFYWM